MTTRATDFYDRDVGRDRYRATSETMADDETVGLIVNGDQVWLGIARDRDLFDPRTYRTRLNPWQAVAFAGQLLEAAQAAQAVALADALLEAQEAKR